MGTATLLEQAALWGDEDEEEDEDYVGEGVPSDDSGGGSDDEEDDDEEGGDEPIVPGSDRDVLPKLPGVGAARLKALRAELGTAWRYAGPAELRKVDGIGAGLAARIHASLVEVAWNVTVLEEVPDGANGADAPVIAKPVGAKESEEAAAAEEQGGKKKKAPRKRKKSAGSEADGVEDREEEAAEEGDAGKKGAGSATKAARAPSKPRKKAKAAGGDGNGKDESDAADDGEGVEKMAPKKRRPSDGSRGGGKGPEIEVGATVRVTDGPHTGRVGRVDRSNKSWLHVLLEPGGEDVSVRPMHLARVETGNGEGDAGAGGRPRSRRRPTVPTSRQRWRWTRAAPLLAGRRRRRRGRMPSTLSMTARTTSRGLAHRRAPSTRIRVGRRARVR